MMEINGFLEMRKRNLDSIELLRWFLENTLDNYLDQNAETVIKAIKKDSPPEDLLKFLFYYEQTHKNRKEVLNILHG
jgi:hypothetical protein